MIRRLGVVLQGQPHPERGRPLDRHAAGVVDRGVRRTGAGPLPQIDPEQRGTQVAGVFDIAEQPLLHGRIGVVERRHGGVRRPQLELGELPFRLRQLDTPIPPVHIPVLYPLHPERGGPWREVQCAHPARPELIVILDGGDEDLASLSSPDRR